MRNLDPHLAGIAAMLLVMLGGISCANLTTQNTVDVKPIHVDPIHITADVNVNVRVERQLDDFFSFEQKYAATSQPAATQPANAAM
jgi:hypothetical protein